MTASQTILIRAALVLTCGALWACGGDGAAPQPPTPGPQDPNPGTTISGGERLGWNQAAPSAAAVRSYGFALYIDGARSALGDARCSDVAGSNGYECSGALPGMAPGRHELQLTASAGGAESARSAILVVTVAARQTAEQTAATAELSAHRSGEAPRVCFNAAPPACYAVEALAHGLRHVSELASLSREEVVFVEDRTRIRVLADGALLDDPALMLSTDAEIRGIVPDPDYGRNGLVYVAEIRQEASGRVVRVVRYRSVHARFGESATTVGDIPVASPEVRLAVGPDRRVFLAMPATPAAPLRHRGALYDGSVLRFEPDGSVPRDARASSPIFSEGYAQPGALAAGLDLWFVGSNDGSRYRALVVDPGGRGGMRTPRGGELERGQGGVMALRAAAHERSAVFLSTDPSGTLLRRMVFRAAGAGDLRAWNALLPRAVAPVSAIGLGPGGEIYVAGGARAGRGTSIVRLVPIQ